MDLSRLSDALGFAFNALAGIEMRFQRHRRWTPKFVVMALVVLAGNRSIPSIEDLMTVMARLMGWSSVPSESTFIEARQRLVNICPQALSDVWQNLSSAALTLIPERRRTLGGLRWIAIDGSWIWTPRSKSTVKEFEQPKTKNGKLHYPQALLVTALDVLTRIPVACGVGGHAAGERNLLMGFIDAFGPGMVAMMDRGFPGKSLFREFIDRRSDVLWRMCTADVNSWDCVYAFLHDPQKPREQIVDLPLPSSNASQSSITIKVRLIRRSFPRGRPKKGQTRETMVLMTTLLDASTWSIKRLVEMYERRWVIETWYRDVKVRFDVERFHSNSADGVRQEILALMIWMTLIGLIERDAYQRVERSRGPQDPESPTRFQISNANVAQVASDMFNQLVAGEKLETIIKSHQRELEWLSQTARRRRPGRSEIRERKAPHGRWNG